MSEPASTDLFRQEAEDLLVQLEHALLDLETRPNDGEVVATVFRALHTIKGSASVFGLDALAAFTHQIESVFNRVRAGEIHASSTLIAATLSAKDHIRAMIGGDETIDAGQQVLAALTAAITPVPPGGGTVRGPVRSLRIRFVLPEDGYAIGSDPAALIAQLLALGSGEVVGPPPLPLAETAEADYRRDWEVRLTTGCSLAEIEDVFLFIRDTTELQIEPVAPPKSAKPVESVIRIESGRIDGLIDQVGELVIAESRLRQLVARRDDPDLAQVAEEIEQLTAGLRDTALGIRMVPISSLFARFRRPVHDLARELDKTVALATLGEETELDKAMVESLYDPLLHLVRNAVDHGIEDGSARHAAGKAEQGVVTLSAGHVGAEVLIAVSDDGGGLDRQAILAKAWSIGILPPEADPPDAELYSLVFRPGFSTARSVSSISGRGVGLDVVKTQVESLRGLIDVASQPGRGTTITLRLPLTLAIIDGLLVRVADQRYVIPMAVVEECVAMDPADPKPDSNFLTLREQLIPFLRLREAFGFDGPPPAKEMVVIANVADRRIGLVVDRLLGDHQTVVKSLGRLHREVRCISGATILGDGRIALILDVLSLIALRQTQEESARAVREGRDVD